LAATSDPIVGIDLGTTNSVVASWDESGNATVLADKNGYKIQPSVVAFHPNGSVIVGAEAKQRRVIDPQNTVYSVKRLIGRTFNSREVTAARGRMPFALKEGANQQPVIITRAGEFAVPEISAIVLDHMRGIAKRALGNDPSRSVVTVPANFTDAQRSATATAGAIAGLTVVRVLNEPTAAALAYGHTRKLDEVIAVYDFGGGTFDVTLLELRDTVFRVLATAGDSFLGGDDIDEILVDHMVSLFLQQQRVDLSTNVTAMQRLRAVAEQIKIELSRKKKAVVKIDEIAYGTGGKPLDLALEVTRDQLIEKAKPVIERTFPVCTEAAALAGLPPGKIDDVVMVGGTTKIPYVRERVTEFFNKRPRTDVNPDEAVAVGAALQGISLQRILGGAGASAGTARRTARTPAAVPPPTPPPTPPHRTAAHTERRAQPGAHRDEFPIPGASKAEGAAFARLVPAKAKPPERPHTNTLTGRASPPVPTPGDGASLRPDAPSVSVPSSFDDIETDVPTEVRRSPQDEAPTGVHESPQEAIPTEVEDAPRGVPEVSLEQMLGAAMADELDRANTEEAPFISAQPDTSTELDLGPAPAAADAPPAFDVGLPAAADSAPPLFDFHTPSAGPDAPTAMNMDAPFAAATPEAAPPIAPPPMILDVTPHSLGIGTVAGYCEQLIERNSGVPTEMKRIFATSHDQQEMVRIRVCQGESRRIDENVILGDMVLEGLPPRPRGAQIEVTFHIDANGILNIRALDQSTGQEQRASLNLLGAQTDEEVAAARDRLREIRG